MLVKAQTSQVQTKMEDDILRAAKAEASRLEAMLHDHPIYQRLQAVCRVIELYDRPDVSPVLTPPGPNPGGSPRRGHVSRASTQAWAIRDGAARFLRQKGARASSGEIYAALLLEGVEVKGKKPLAVVASYLSHSELFDAVRGEGYGLAEWDKPAEPSSTAEAPASSELAGAPKITGEVPMNLL